MKNIIYYLVFILLLTSCGSDNKISPATQNAIVVNDAYWSSFSIRNTSNQEVLSPLINQNLFDELALSSLSSLFNSHLDVNDLQHLKCSNFNQLDTTQKKLFYVVFLASIAERESDFNPADQTGSNIGLLQIDPASAVRHAREIVGDRVTINELSVPETNLSIGAFILKNQISGKWKPDVAGRLFPDDIYYWEVLNSKYRNRVIKSFLNNRSNLPFCNE